MPEENFPVHDSLDIIDGETIYRTDEWWKAVVAYQRYGRRIGIYLWKWREEEDRWVRKQKYVIKSAEDWETDRNLVNSYLAILEGEQAPSESGTQSTGSSGSRESDSRDAPNVDDLLGDMMDLSNEGRSSSEKPLPSENEDAQIEIDCPVKHCPYVGSPKSVAGHVSGKPDDDHDWQALGYDGAVEFRRKYLNG